MPRPNVKKDFSQPELAELARMRPELAELARMRPADPGKCRRFDQSWRFFFTADGGASGAAAPVGFCPR
jgi:hypothetical protein